MATRAANQVADPELPFMAVGDLGIVREIILEGNTLVARISPTYTGCPAVSVIERDIEQAIKSALDEFELSTRFSVRVERQLAPAWTTDWITDRGRLVLAENGIAPPLRRGESSTENASLSVASIPLFQSATVSCPLCSSNQTECLSEFGSTPCKAQYRCNQCGEPFDHFKCLR